MKCPICASSNIESININHDFFRHMDFATVRQSGCIGRCTTCQSLFGIANENIIADIDNLFRSSAYSSSKQTKHTLIVEEYKEPVTRSFLQVELLCKLLNNEKPSILDIGCFDGALLAEFDNRFKSADLHGFDVNERLRLVFPTKDNFHFWSSDLEYVQGKFDLICMSHVMSYVRDIPHLMEQIKRLIKPGGLLFVQTPNISKNLYYILMGDQYYYYTTNILKNTLQHFGFEFSSLDTKWFPREIVGIAKLTAHNANVQYIEELQIYQCVEYLNGMATKLNEISSSSQRGLPSAKAGGKPPCSGEHATDDRHRLGVLGTTVNAAFVDSILGERIFFFADENYNRVGSKFRNKEVLHPRSLNDSDLLIIPYGELSQQIKERFENEYRGRFMSL